jgi:hypothetical protein
MTSAVDSSVILDVLVGDAVHADKSEALLRIAAAEGRLVICDCVLTEIFPVLGSLSVMDSFLAEWELVYIPTDKPTALLAGQMFSRFLERGGKGGRVVPDFLIGAHALRHADRLLARDRGYLRDYFKGLRVLPSA